MAAIDPEGQIGLNPEEFGGHDGIKVDDSRVFEAAFRRGWVRSAYVNDVEGGPQLALHGADKEIVMTTLELLLAEGLDVGNIGMVGHFDGFDYDGPIDEIG